MVLRTLGLALPLAVAAGAQARTWTSVSGSKVEAEFVSLQGAMVVLQKPEGQQLKIGLNFLAKEDQEFARAQAGTAPGPAAVTPAVNVAAAGTRAGTLPAPTALAGRTSGIRTGNTLTEEQIAGLQRESTEEKSGEKIQFNFSFAQTRLDEKELKKWDPKDGIKYRLTCELVRSKTVKGKTVGERLGGSAKFYLTDESGTTVMAKSQSLDSMCPT